MQTVTSRDGTLLAYDVHGDGAPLIMVEGAFCGRHFGPTAALAAELGRDFRVYHYDRRARGDSSPSTDYSVARELEDLEAMLRVAGPGAGLVGFSSGACLALEAAAAGLPVGRLAIYEPPYMVGPKARKVPPSFREDIQALIADGRNGKAVEYFMVRLIGMPPMFLPMMWLSKVWKSLCAQAPSLPFDMEAVNGFAPPAARLAAIAVPTLVMHGAKTMPVLKDAATLCARTIPGARHVELPGQSHEVKKEAIAPHLRDFFAASAARAAA